MRTYRLWSRLPVVTHIKAEPPPKLYKRDYSGGGRDGMGNSTPIRVRGVEYATMKEVRKALHVCDATVKVWLAEGVAEYI